MEQNVYCFISPQGLTYFRLLTSTYFTKTKNPSNTIIYFHLKNQYNHVALSEVCLSEGEIFAISDNMPGLHRNRGGDDNPPGYECAGPPNWRQYCDD